ncbi:hypothetical protein NK8_64810 (plasmid) [Caballeronia sp. NK8]|nr:hypothetical protein NK8_64810 [Caballeronia sp. NK8]
MVSPFMIRMRKRTSAGWFAGSVSAALWVGLWVVAMPERIHEGSGRLSIGGECLGLRLGATFACAVATVSDLIRVAP